MSRSLPPLAKLTIGLGVSVACLLAFKLIAEGNGYRLTKAGLLGVTLGWGVVGGWLVLRYWRGIDEAAREAQKWAWLWGGSLGMGVGLLAITWNVFGVVGLAPPDASPRDLMIFGAGAVLLAQVVGFKLAWAAWWWSRR